MLFAGTQSEGVFRSTDDGATWAAANTGMDTYVAALATTGTNTSSPMLFAGTSVGVFLSPDNGLSWAAVNNGMGTTNVYALAVRDTNVSAPKLFAATNSGVFLSSDNGLSWSPVNSGMGGIDVFALAVIGTNLFAGTSIGVFLSTNNGTTWHPVNFGIANTVVLAFAVISANTSSPTLFAGTLHEGVYLSSNNGASWVNVRTGLINPNITALAVKAPDSSSPTLFAGTFDAVGEPGGVFLSTDKGTSWAAINIGLTNKDTRSLAISVPYLFAGTNGSGVWRRPLSELSIVSPNELSMTFGLDQNYPNPFNPSTEISFTLSERSMVQLDVFDMLGRKLQTLVHGEMEAGLHSMRFDAVHLARGIYTACLTANGGRREMKMVLGR